MQLLWGEGVLTIMERPGHVSFGLAASLLRLLLQHTLAVETTGRALHFGSGSNPRVCLWHCWINQEMPTDLAALPLKNRQCCYFLQEPC